MKIYDITRTVQDAPIYPGSEPVRIEPLSSLANGDGYDSSMIHAGSHMGTHADAFSHFLPEGLSVDKMPLEHFCGGCRVLTVPPDDLIKLEDIRGRFGGVDRLVLHGGGNAFLCEQAAEYIAACGVKLVVTDALSVAPEDNEPAVHQILMRSGVAIVENAVLDGVPDGDYIIFAAPVKLGGLDGGPVRAVLIGEESAAPEINPLIFGDNDMAVLDKTDVTE